MQRTLIAGDTLNYQADVAGYIPADGWSLRYRLTPRSASAAAIDIIATASGTSFLVQVGPAITAGYTAGEYTWASWVERAGERYTLGSGQITIRANPATLAPGADTRTQAERALDDAKAALAAWTPTTRRYSIAGREMEFNSTAEIIAVVQHWQNEVKREANAVGMAAGRASRRQLHVRMGRA